MEKYIRNKFIERNNIKPTTELHSYDEKFIKKMEDRTLNKSLSRTQQIIKMINNLQIGITKKYQISGYHDAKIIKTYCDNLNIKCEIVEDDTLTKKQVKAIVCGLYYCCHNCDYQREFINERVPVVYVKITKHEI
jgi:hypothetical protein